MKRSKTKIMLDTLLFLLWAGLMTYSLLGSFLHELMGISLLLLISLHLVLNRKWIAAVSKRFLKMRFSKVKLNYILDAAIGILVLFTIISGILISKDLFYQPNLGNQPLWRFLHGWSAYLSMVLISVHIGLHWSFVRNAFGLRHAGRVLRLVGNLFAASVFAYGLLASARYQYPVYNDKSSDVSKKTTAVSASSNAPSVMTVSERKETVLSANETPQDGETLDDYLSRLICTGCHRRCLLISPRCNVGANQAAKAEQVYEEYQGDTPSDGSDQDDLAEDNAQGDSYNGKDEKLSSDFKSEASGLIDVFSIMGMYSAGTYYVGRFAARRKGKDE